MSSCSLPFPLSISLASTLPLLLELVTVLDYFISHTKQLSKLPKSTKVESYGNNVFDVIIMHVITGDAQTSRPTDKQM